MHVRALFQVSSSSRTSFRSLRLLRRSLSRLAAMPGQVSCRAFRAMDPSDALIVVSDWASAGAARAALADPLIQRGIEEAVRAGYRIEPVELLPPAFDRRLAPRACGASLVRLHRSQKADAGAASACRA